MPDFLKLETKENLDQLVADRVEESLTLEYKASPALAKDSKRMDELCKDVSAMANSAGGQIIYGIPEIEHKPQPVDAGSDGAAISREWIEQVLLSRVQPRMTFFIKPIEVTLDRLAYVITVPQSSTAHQAPDGKYYKRFNFSSVPMADYEIRDAMGRSTTPILDLMFRFGDGKRATTTYMREGRDETQPVVIIPILTNDSATPAFYAAVTIYLDKRITLQARGDWPAGNVVRAPQGSECHTLPKLLGIPTTFPIFKERPHPLGEFVIAIGGDYFRRANVDFVFGYDIKCPGFHFSRFGELTFVDGNIRFAFPN